MPNIHPTAIVHASATIADDASVGPLSLIGKGVSLGAGVEVRSHVVIEGDTTIGDRTVIFPFACIGAIPQDKKFAGEDTRLEIGSDCILREHVTINPGTSGGGGVTSVGDRCLLMVGAHVAHDCRIADDVILVNNTLLAGHVSIGAHAIVGGGAALHQFVRIGEHAFIGGLSGVENDVIPFGSAIGNRAHLGGLNLVGLKRRGFSREAIHALRGAYRMLFEGDGTLKERIGLVESTYANVSEVQRVVTFVREGKDRAICTPRHGRAG